MYVARCDQNCIDMTDPEGNYFKLKGDQSLSFTLAVSMGDELESPRCTEPGVPYKHPHVSFLPLPEDVPPPRLLVVYGDGEAEELVLPRDVQEAMRTASADKNAVVLKDEQLGAPMENCKCHTIFKTANSDAARLTVDPVDLPPVVAGSHLAGVAGSVT